MHRIENLERIILMVTTSPMMFFFSLVHRHEIITIHFFSQLYKDTGDCTVYSRPIIYVQTVICKTYFRKRDERNNSGRRSSQILVPTHLNELCTRIDLLRGSMFYHETSRMLKFNISFNLQYPCNESVFRVCINRNACDLDRISIANSSIFVTNLK